MASYKDAISWIADMDDCLWLCDDHSIVPSVTACMVSDIFKKPIEKVIKDITKAVKDLDALNSGNC